MYDVVRYDRPTDFLARAERWLLAAEDRNNLVLSISYGLAEATQIPQAPFLATIEEDGRLAGCAIRTPPYKVLVTQAPIAAAPALARVVATLYDEIPGVLGPPEIAEAVAMAWVEENGGGWRPGFEHRIYRLDAVIPPARASGSLRVATEADVDLAVAWGEGFARDSGIGFPSRRDIIGRWVAHQALYVWEDDDPRSIAVAHGRTPNGVRIGYVYTPPEWRGRGYASQCVADLSQRMLDEGLDFCVLYTDLSNPTSNAIYRRLGYEPIADARDFELIAEGAS